MAAIYLIVAAVTAAIWFYYHGPHSRFRRYGLKYLTPIPLLGDMGRVVFRTQHVLDNMNRIYNAFPNERFIGVLELIKPVVVIRDPDMVKRILVQDFDHFQDHGIDVDPKVDDVFGKNLFVLKGQYWKKMRSIITPVFTSAKLKVMMPFMLNAGNNVITSFRKSMNESGKDYVELDMKDVTSRFANDILASSVYGLTLDSHSQEDTEFYEMTKLMSVLNYSQLLKFIAYQVFPGVMRLTNITMFSKRSARFFKELLRTTLEKRKEMNIHRPDLIELYLQSNKDSLNKEDKSLAADDKSNGAEHNNGKKNIDEKAWSDSDLLAQVVGFLVAGFDVTASSMAYLAHMLALNPHVQEKLAQEIKEYAEKNGGQWSYEAVLEMPYLEMVVSETLRMWTASIAERECVKDYNLGRPNDKSTKDYIIRKGDTVRIFFRSMHRDPEYYPDPDKFNPERFAKENREKIRPGTYHPFGAGPRICIGSRFAMIEIKVMFVCLLQHMEVLPCERTAKNIELTTSSLIPLNKGGHWVRLRPRSSI